MEIWKPIKGTDFYDISNCGRVRSRNYLGHGTTRVLAIHPDTKGYMRVRLLSGTERKTYKVHRLVAEAFLDNPNGLPEVNHRDGDKQNNHVSNLEWSTSSNNISHAYSAGLKEKNRAFARKLGSTIGRKALDKYLAEEHQVAVIATNLETGETIEFESQKLAANALGVPQGNISKVLNGARKSAGGYCFKKRG